MATLPAPIDRKAFEAPRRDFEAMEKQLRAITGVPTLMQINRAKECDDIAKAFLDKKNPDSPEAKIGPHREKAYSTWKGLVAWMADEERTPKAVRSLYSALAGRYERERQRKIAEQKRLDEQRQLEDQKRNVKAEVDHLVDVAAKTNDPSALQAAMELENAPLAPVVSTVDTKQGKLEGSSTTFVKTGRIVDIRAFLRSLADYESLVDVVEVKDVPQSETEYGHPSQAGPALTINQSALDDKLKRGLTFNGLKVLDKPVTRNTSR